jgi:hypothetical protein
MGSQYTCVADSVCNRERSSFKHLMLLSVCVRQCAGKRKDQAGVAGLRLFQEGKEGDLWSIYSADRNCDSVTYFVIEDCTI